ncbi:MFS transporter [Deferribacteraceae bacterium V6Fe1]|nr:MFS transporter [Deferribacteraceae bacterium V6Fe1]
MKNRYLILLTFLSMYFMSYFFRVSTAVIAPDLINDFKISPKELGLLSSAYFYTFAAAQFFIGPLLDKKGPRIVVFLFGLIASLGAFIFALGQSFTVSLLGRALIGLGVSCAYMGTLKIISIWFEPSKFATLSSTAMAFGNIGALSAAAPLAYLTSIFGWRGSLSFFAFITLTSALAILFFTDDKFKTDKKRVTTINIPYRKILFDKNFLIIAFMEFSWFGSFMAIQGLWGGPYLIENYNLPKTAAGNILSMISIGFILGAPVWGYISDKVLNSRKKVIIIGLSIFLLTFIVLSNIFFEHASALYLIFFIFGLAGGFGVTGYAHVKELFPAEISGTAMSYVNFFAILGAAILQHFIGYAIEYINLENSGHNKFSTSFIICEIFIFISLALYLFVKEKSV